MLEIVATGTWVADPASVHPTSFYSYQFSKS